MGAVSAWADFSSGAGVGSVVMSVGGLVLGLGWNRVDGQPHHHGFAPGQQPDFLIFGSPEKLA